MTMTPQSGDRTPLVVVGASAGGVEALRQLASVLPVDLPASVLVVLHVPADSPSALPAILRRAGDLPVRQASEGATPRAGEILVAPPDHHLVVVDGGVTLTRGAKENGHRPAIDVLFRSAARARGAGVLGIVLSGALDDGAAGAVAIARHGGRVVVQHFDDALYSSMPRATAAAVPGADQVPVARMGDVLRDWAREVGDRAGRPTEEHNLRKEVEVAELEPGEIHDPARPGDPSGYGCPDCGGALYQIEEANLVRYRCRVGHAWSAESLLARQTVDLEGALWMALRSLEEKAALNSDMSRRATHQGHARVASRLEEGAEEALRAAELVRRLIAEIGAVAATPDLVEGVGDR